MKPFIVLLFFVFFTIWDAEAQIFSLTRVTDTGNSTVNAFIDTELQKVENDINQDLPNGKPTRLMEGMANSQAASSKGLATDYISHFDSFMVGGGLGLGADLEENKDTDSDLSGAGVTGGIQIGLNTSLFTNSVFGLDAKRTTVMVNFFKYDIDRKMDDNDVGLDLLSFGFSGTYRWKEQTGNRLFGWDGVRLHTGYQYSSAKLDFNTKLNEKVNETAGGSTISGTIDGSPAATIDTSTHSIPIEISSGVNFLWVVSFYGGLGTDINFGSAKGKADANAQRSTITCTGGACGGGTNVDVDAEANIDEEGKVKPLFLRGFAGLQFNLPYVRIYTHANKIFGTEVYSFAAGLRLAF